MPLPVSHLPGPPSRTPLVAGAAQEAPLGATQCRTPLPFLHRPLQQSPSVRTADSPVPHPPPCGRAALFSSIWGLIYPTPTLICDRLSPLSVGSLWPLSQKQDWTRWVSPCAPAPHPKSLTHHKGKRSPRERPHCGVPDGCPKKDPHICDLP